MKNYSQARSHKKRVAYRTPSSFRAQKSAARYRLPNGSSKIYKGKNS